MLISTDGHVHSKTITLAEIEKSFCDCKIQSTMRCLNLKADTNVLIPHVQKQMEAVLVEEGLKYKRENVIGKALPASRECPAHCKVVGWEPKQ